MRQAVGSNEKDLEFGVRGLALSLISLAESQFFSSIKHESLETPTVPISPLSIIRYVFGVSPKTLRRSGSHLCGSPRRAEYRTHYRRPFAFVKVKNV